MYIPKELKYTEEHEWIRVEGDIAYIGITDFAQKELGDIVYVEVETQGHTLARGDTFGSIEAVKTVSDLYMPIGGTVLEINEALESEPELVNKDPYSSAWIIKIGIEDISSLDYLMDKAAYAALISK